MQYSAHIWNDLAKYNFQDSHTIIFLLFLSFYNLGRT